LEGSNGNKLTRNLIDPSTVSVGNTRGTAEPERVWSGDANADGSQDLVFFFSRAAVQELRLSSDELDGHIGLHYLVREDLHFLVADIYNLGPPISLPEEALLEPEDWNDLGGRQQLDQIDPTIGTDDVPSALHNVPKVTRLGAVAPNPFMHNTLISFDLSSGAQVNLAIYDLRGRMVRQLVAESRAAGRYQITWDGRDHAGRKVTRGVYFVQFIADAVHQTRKAVILK
jgi:hypothetical protein